MISREEIRSNAALLAKPVDFEDLAVRGLLVKEGRWYRFTNIHDLPEHVRMKINQIKVKIGVPGGLAKFEKLSKATIKNLERLQQI